MAEAEIVEFHSRLFSLRFILDTPNIYFRLRPAPPLFDKFSWIL